MRHQFNYSVIDTIRHVSYTPSNLLISQLKKNTGGRKKLNQLIGPHALCERNSQLVKLSTARWRRFEREPLQLMSVDITNTTPCRIKCMKNKLMQINPRIIQYNSSEIKIMKIIRRTGRYPADAFVKIKFKFN